MTTSSPIIESREEVMISSSVRGKRVLRTSHFLNPRTMSMDTPVPQLLENTNLQPQNKVIFNGWKAPQQGWGEWIHSLRSHQSTWRQAETGEMIKLNGNLCNTRKEFARTTAKKASHGRWFSHFRDSFDEEEHAALLALWLSRFVFSGPNDGTVAEHCIPFAVRLSKGIRIALAPAVLASIYKDLTMLKGGGLNSNNASTVKLNAPLQLVQIWAWERFKKLRPNPNDIQIGESYFAKWHGVKPLKNVNISEALDSELDQGFLWRPYGTSKTLHRGGEAGRWIFVYSDTVEPIYLDEDNKVNMHSFVKCLRTTELVAIGMEDCIQRYSPHRVARQFGLDQDILIDQPRSNENEEVAWNAYNREIKGSMVYVPAECYNPRVSLRYFQWWKKSRKNYHDDVLVPPGFAPN
ncbi:hypothetical protein ACFE04_015334 [Oxalis oulophora]